MMIVLVSVMMLFRMLVRAEMLAVVVMFVVLSARFVLFALFPFFPGQLLARLEYPMLSLPLLGDDATGLHLVQRAIRAFVVRFLFTSAARL